MSTKEATGPIVDEVNEVEQLIIVSGCVRQPYIVDHCTGHGAAWPYDETVCNFALSRMGFKPREFLGQGRAKGDPVLNNHVWS